MKKPISQIAFETGQPISQIAFDAAINIKQLTVDKQYSKAVELYKNNLQYLEEYPNIHNICIGFYIWAFEEVIKNTEMEKRETMFFEIIDTFKKYKSHIKKINSLAISGCILAYFALHQYQELINLFEEYWSTIETNYKPFAIGCAIYAYIKINKYSTEDKKIQDLYELYVSKGGDFRSLDVHDPIHPEKTYTFRSGSGCFLF